MIAAPLTFDARCRTCRGLIPAGTVPHYVLGRLTCPDCRPDNTEENQT